jgi:hypothetical protein
MHVQRIAACSAAVFFLTAGIAAAETNQFGPFAEDDHFVDDFKYQPRSTFDTKADVYGDVYEDEYKDDEYIDDLGPELWVGIDPYAGIAVD